MARKTATAEQLAFGLELAHQLASQRKRQHVTASALAETANLSVDTVRALEAGRIPSPGFQTVHLVAQALKLSLDELAASAARATTDSTDSTDESSGSENE
jgi:transcriptional regulator with XRE-family HTH domain